MDPLYVNYDKRKNATSNSAVPTPTASTMPVFGAPATPAAPAPTSVAPAPDPTIPLASTPAPADPAPVSAPAPTPAAPIAPAPSASPADTLVAELDAPAAEQNPFASFQNNTPIAEPQPMQQFAPSELPAQPLQTQSLQAQPFPTQPIGPAPISSGTGDIVLDMSQPKGGINKKLLAIISGVVLVAVVAVVAVFFLIPKDRATKEDAEELYNLLGWVSLTGQCSDVADNVDDLDYTVERYREIANNCREKGKSISAVVSKLEKIDEIGFKQILGDIKNDMSEVVVSGDELDSEVHVFESLHEWFLKMDKKSGAYLSDDDIREISSSLTESGNERLREFGEKWTEKKIAVANAELDIELFGYEDILAKKLEKTESELNEVIENDLPKLVESLKIGQIQEGLTLRGDLLKYDNYLRENYEKIF